MVAFATPRAEGTVGSGTKPPHTDHYQYSQPAPSHPGCPPSLSFAIQVSTHALGVSMPVLSQISQLDAIRVSVPVRSQINQLDAMDWPGPVVPNTGHLNHYRRANPQPPRTHIHTCGTCMDSACTHVVHTPRHSSCPGSSCIPELGGSGARPAKPECQ